MSSRSRVLHITGSAKQHFNSVFGFIKRLTMKDRGFFKGRNAFRECFSGKTVRFQKAFFLRNGVIIFINDESAVVSVAGGLKEKESVMKYKLLLWSTHRKQIVDEIS